MNYLWKSYMKRVTLLFLLLASGIQTSPLPGHTSTKRETAGKELKEDSGTNEKIIAERFRALSKPEQNKAKTLAARRLQSNLIPVLRELSRSKKKRIPQNVKDSAQSIATAFENGKLLQPLAKALPTIMTYYPKGSIGQQLVTVLKALSHNAPPRNRGPLDILVKFLVSNLNGVNNLLSSLLSETSDLLKGVVPALVGSLAALNETVGGTIDSIAELLGSLLSG